MISYAYSYLERSLTNSAAVTAAKDANQDPASKTEMKEVNKHQMVSADNKTTTSSADHGHKAAAAVVADGVAILMLTVVLAVNPDHAKSLLEVKQQQMGNAASRTATLYAAHGRWEDVVAAADGVETVWTIAALDASLDLVLTVIQIQQHQQAKKLS